MKMPLCPFCFSKLQGDVNEHFKQSVDCESLHREMERWVRGLQLNNTPRTFVPQEKVAEVMQWPYDKREEFKKRVFPENLVGGIKVMIGINPDEGIIGLAPSHFSRKEYWGLYCDFRQYRALKSHLAALELFEMTERLSHKSRWLEKVYCGFLKRKIDRGKKEEEFDFQNGFLKIRKSDLSLIQISAVWEIPQEITEESFFPFLSLPQNDEMDIEIIMKDDYRHSKFKNIMESWGIIVTDNGFSTFDP